MENSAILREWFDRVDSDKTGAITPPQLKSALAVGNLDFSLSVVQQMIRMYDFDNNGTMSFEEFVALNKFLLKVQQAFSDLERDRGYLVPEEVYEGTKKLGFSLDSPAFYTVCESFDQKKNGRFPLDDFISLCVFLQSARNLFNSFDTSKQGRITLDLNQFVYCRRMSSRDFSSKLAFKLTQSVLHYDTIHQQILQRKKLQIVEYETLASISAKPYRRRLLEIL